MKLSNLERIEDQYPELRFWLIDVQNPHYHGHIDGHDVYINENQPELDWLVTALHEATHHELDSGDLSNLHSIKTLHAEGEAVRESKKKYKIMFTSNPDRR